MSAWKTHVVAETIVILMACGLRAQAAEPAVEGGGLKTFSAAGKEATVLNGYKEAELIAHDGRGCLTHMWFGGDWTGYEKTRIRIYVDGDKTPSIDMQLGLGHGVGFGDPARRGARLAWGRPGTPAASTTRFASRSARASV